MVLRCLIGNQGDYNRLSEHCSLYNKNILTMSLYKKLFFTAISSVTFFYSVNIAEAMTISIEDPTVQSYPITDGVFMVDFNNQTLGNDRFSLTNGNITYTYDAELAITESSIWGGANSSQFITNSTLEGSYNLSINQKQKYFGFWWSAGDPYNKITFKNDGNVVGVLQTEDIVNHINSIDDVAVQSAYFGNPNGGNNEYSLREIYTFVNVFFNDNGEAYDEIVVEIMPNDTEAEFESDNHTFSVTAQEIRGNIVVIDENLYAD